MNNKLKNPVWHSLKETHKNFAIQYDEVHFYDPNICPFGAFTNTEKTKDAINEYAKLTDKFFLVSENEIPIYDTSKIILHKKIDGVQMVLQNLQEIDITEEIIPLTENHIDEIYNLVWLVMPGYYKKRTFDMGKYFGIFKNNQLVSITGQRMQTNDFIEISAVVTHPEYTKRGYAKQLTQYVTKDILKDKKHPILHTDKGNPAIKLYEKLGYEIIRDMNWWYFHKK
ncbi:GNAT family N-acetyltransferase [Tenacibaculum sp. S7007]|uniref:GNAT family N-acetyltransferase n=1 Tax=Tenacibaculum pelagium TaxID=2759527 RepID=A0A839ANG9_9FLAO|nr:GNAT family N-acetyltransferase [Tenacibaculum pelagium]MBA6155271.1 GNAT family N-acetyltransferase [Tenacibaculum pelagium]